MTRVSPPLSVQTEVSQHNIAIKYGAEIPAPFRMICDPFADLRFSSSAIVWSFSSLPVTSVLFSQATRLHVYARPRKRDLKRNFTLRVSVPASLRETVYRALSAPQNPGDLRSTLYLKASCADTHRAPELLLLLLCQRAARSEELKPIRNTHLF